MKWWEFRKRNADLEREIKSDLELEEEEQRERGLPPEEARHAARRAFGNATLIKEHTLEQWGWLPFERLCQDFRFAVRQLGKSPGFTITVSCTLALGIGLNAAVFHLLREVISPGLPVPDPQQIERLVTVIPSQGPYSGMFSQPAYERLRRATQETVPLAAHSWISDCSVSKTTGSASARAKMQLVSTSFFSVLGVLPSRGRLLVNSDAQPTGGLWPAVLRYGYWQSQFGADPSITGRSILINGIPAVIIGIAPKPFLGVISGQAPDIWLPLEAQPFVRYFLNFDSLGYGSGVNYQAPFTHQDALFWLWLVARVPPAQANAAASAWTSAFQTDLQLFARFASPEDRKSVLAARFELEPAARSESALIEKYSEPMVVLMAMCSLILLISCVNLAGLQRTRLLARSREFAIRLSLGASRRRVVRQLVMESGILAVLGAVSSLIVAAGAGPLLLRWASNGPAPIALDASLDWHVYVFVVGLLLAATLSFGLLPALWSSGKDLASTMKLSGSQSLSWSGGQSGAWMVACQVSLSLILVLLTTAFVGTFLNLNRIDAGLDRQHVLSVHIDFHGGGYDVARLSALYPQMVERARVLPHVRAAALEMCPIPDCGWRISLHAAGYPELSQTSMQGQEDVVGVGYFATLEIPLLRGRDFSDDDRMNAQNVAIVSESFAKKLFGNEDPIGKRVGFGPAPADATYQIVGEVGDARVNDLRSIPPPLLYLPLSQHLGPIAGFEIGAAGDPRKIAGEVRAALLSLDPGMPLEDIVPLDVLYDRTITAEHLLARLTMAFGAMALVLAAIGLYGVLSFRVTARANEIGVRMAMGAARTAIIRLVIEQAGRILLAGTFPGLILGFVLRRLIKDLLYGVHSTDWFWTSVVAVLVLLIVGMLAAVQPAIRAASLDPMQALRSE
jgi:predicted permease